MKVIISDAHKLHNPRYEWNFGRNQPYPEKKIRDKVIRKELQLRGYAKLLEPAKEYPIEHITAVHDEGMVEHIRSCSDLKEGEFVYPHIFPYRLYSLHPKTNLKRSGYYCFDVGTQIGRHTFAAAKTAVDTALHGADLILSGKERIVFSLCRPPGHHADYGMYGGYCYFNNAAAAAYYMFSQGGKTAIIDLDYHHGNGTQGIFYDIPHVLFISIHGDPQETYPYFSGFASEKGLHLGKGTNINIPLPANTGNEQYRIHLLQALEAVKNFKPRYFIVSMGFDTFTDDVQSDFLLTSEFYREIGIILGELNIPLLICLEGGYYIRDLGINAANFVEGLLKRE